MNHKILIIPGNPPARFFYEAWKKELELITHYDIVIDYYPVFENNACSQQYINDLEAFYAKNIVKDTPGDVILIGHSFGGHIALKILEKYHEKIKRCVLLFPFLHSPGFRGRCILKILHGIHQRPLLKSGLTRLLKPASYFYNNINRLSTHELESSLNLAFHEHKTIAQKKNIFISPELHPKITLYYTHNDTWCTKKVVTSLHPEIHTKLIDVQHDFVISSKQRKIINKHLFTN